MASVCTVQAETGDYLDKKTGLLRCGKCGGYKERLVEVPKSIRPSGKLRVKSLCPCGEEREAQAEKERERRRFETHMDILRRDGISDPAYLQYTFDRDDGRNPQVSAVCRRYVENWRKMWEENIGVLFYGGVGTGKTFFAAAIANSLLDKQVSASITNLPRLLQGMQARYPDARQEAVGKLTQYSLLVIDDLGVERDTSYSWEAVYNVIDTRYRSGKPLIITTNLDLNDLENPGDLPRKRIYDRVMELCPIRLRMDGESRRKENAARRMQYARQVLKGKS